VPSAMANEGSKRRIAAKTNFMARVPVLNR
jgi:hypothetical protein